MAQLQVDPRPEASDPALSGGLAVHVHDVSVSFPAPDGRLTALQGCSLDVAAGSLTVIIGPNGCGKSTLLRVIAGLLVPDGGRVTIGRDLTRTSRAPVTRGWALPSSSRAFCPG